MSIRSRASLLLWGGYIRRRRRGRQWFTFFAAAEEETEAKYYLGRCHYAGLGVPEDADLGLKLIREAAEEGCEEAETYLFEEGYFVEAGNQEDAKAQTTDGVFTLVKDPSERAKDLHRKLSSGNESSWRKDCPGHIISERFNRGH